MTPSPGPQPCALPDPLALVRDDLTMILSGLDSMIRLDLHVLPYPDEGDEGEGEWDLNTLLLPMKAAAARLARLLS